MQRSWVLIAVVVLGACDKKEAPKPVPPVEKPVVAPKITGPSVTPIKTESVAFVVPKADTKWWGEVNMSCYRAAMSLTGKTSASEAFEKISPTVKEAMAAGDIDIGRDLAAIGAMDCGDTPCLYVAATIPKPEKMAEVLGKLLPNMPQKTVANGHYTIDTPGTRGTRTIHIRVVPLQWTAKPAGDAWNVEAARATHVVFIGGVDGKNVDVDPLTLLADPQAAFANVKDAEGVVGDAHGRCILGRVGPTDFQPGYKLDRARFALAAPAGRDDALMALLDSKRTLDMNVELVLTPAPEQADVEKWVKQGRSWMSNIAGPVRVQFAGNPMLDVYFDMLALLGERGFTYLVKDKSLTFSWRTDRVPAKDLDALERRFQALMGTTP
ncbi:MAG: hypothetical protein M4D80_16795 [Myxococcota bacterium]|nr:hypothetical protein [Deltaproteobacteria bacterium]MDQ3336825.1 hypothetical protein [Myxococcota bacterium]